MTDVAINLTRLCLSQKPNFLLFVGTAGSYGEKKIFDITPAVVFLPILIYYLVKAKWRFIYFPLLQIVVIVFWVGAIFLFFPVLLILFALTFVGVTVEGVFSETKYRCPSCGREYSRDGKCPYCGRAVDAEY